MSAPPPPPIPAEFFSPLYFATVFQLFQTGALCSQAYRYITRSGKDKYYLRGGAALLFALSVFQTAVAIWNAWEIFVSGYGNFAVADRVGWASEIQPLLSVVMAFPMQSLVVYRCCLFVRLKWWAAAPYVLTLAFVGIVGLVNSILVLTFPFNSPTPPPDTTVLSNPIWLISSAVLDTVSCITLIVHLRRSQDDTRSGDMNQLLTRVVRVMWETALPPSLCAIGAVVCHLLIPVTSTTKYMALWSISFIMVLGQLYALSSFITLNFRLDVQQETAGTRGVQFKLTRFTETLPPPSGDIQVNIHSFKTIDSTEPELSTDMTRSVSSSSPRFTRVGSEKDMI